MFTLLLVASLLLGCVRAIPIDNGVQGDPEIECGPRSISVSFNTQNNFEGHVYVKGLFDEEARGCRTSGSGDRRVGAIELPFDICNVERVRSANPKGIFVRTTLVISFHPNFITKVDRAYTLQCFYMEADKTVSTDIEVSMITTGFQTEFVPMPICRYEILDAPDGNIVQFALIGQAVYHKWTCDTETVDTFCMYVYSCFVVDPAGEDRLDLIDESVGPLFRPQWQGLFNQNILKFRFLLGCAIDRYLMGNVEYPTDLMGLKEVHVFKYADRPALFFQCQINIVVKEPNQDCIRPTCAEPSGRGDGQSRRFRQGRGKRSVAGSTDIDVVAHLDTLDITSDTNAVYPSDLAHRAPQSVAAYSVGSGGEGVCLSYDTAVVLLLLAAVLSSVLLTTGAIIHCRDRPDKK